MKHSVPQFIDIEDKLVGPLTINQFIYLIGGGGLAYLSFRFLFSPISFFLAFFFIAFSIFLAFIKVNGRKSEYLVYGIFNYIRKPRIYVWRKGNKAEQANELRKTRELLDSVQKYNANSKDNRWKINAKK